VRRERLGGRLSYDHREARDAMQYFNQMGRMQETGMAAYRWITYASAYPFFSRRHAAIGLAQQVSLSGCPPAMAPIGLILRAR